MKFSRLKILGFKSFCDDTQLIMEDGLTGVVGPNGCGKSNLVEALRWVMGESSYKAMRASGMDDVIFSGSKNRPSRNSAQVTLVLDNSDRSAPNHFNNEDELEITRRIERESGSSYRINGKEVRARDVQLLFADASTGSKSPALVRQGQIGELIAAKPVQRRALLEEAAGISGLHSRRHEAELKLRAAEQNLDRVDDVLAQVASQLDSLKRQSRLATRYRNISGDIRKAEATLFHIRWVNARLAQKENEAEQGRMINQLADKTSAEIKVEKTLAEIEARLTPLRDSEAKTSAALQRLKIHKEQLEAEEKRNNHRQNELAERQKQMAFDERRERDLIAEAAELIGKYKNEQSSIEAENTSQIAATNEAKENLTKIKDLLIKAQKNASIATNQLSQLRANKETAKQIEIELAQRLERLKNQAKQVNDEMSQVQASLAADQAVSEKAKQLLVAKDNFATAEISTQNAEKQVAKVQQEIDDLRPELAKVELDVNAKESEATTLAKVLNVEDGSLWPAIVDDLVVKSGYEIALGAALGDDLEASFDSGAPIFWDKSADKKSDPNLPKQAKSLTNFVSSSDLLTRRLNQIGIVSKSEGAELMKTLQTGQSLVTKEGDLWRWDGYVAKADAPTPAAQRLSQRNRLKELDSEIKTAETERKILQQKSSELTQKFEQARTIEQEQREKWRLSQREIATAQSELELAQNSLANLTSRKTALNEAISLIDVNIKEAQIQLDKAKTAKQNQADETDVFEKTKLLQNEFEQLQQEAQNAKIHLSGFENAAQLRSSRLSQIQNEIESWSKRSTSAKKQFDILETRSNEIKQQLDILAQSPSSLAQKRSLLDEDIEAASQDHKTSSDRLEIAQTQYKQANKNARNASDELSHTREKLARIDERLKSSITQRQQIEQTTQETLSIPASKTAQIANLKPHAPLPDESAIEKRVDRLKAERERLGGVNLGAEREAKEIKEKLEIMVNDKDDLINAITKLRSGIFSLNKEGRARLNDAFDKVNTYFKELFTSLFGGGEAELKFVQSDDPLQAGLEIIARPPGKKPQIMTLLSGGEQALTALSLIFAVFLTNPAPICVLDEVDAPLDDANVSRFCDLLDSMSKRTDTRFLVVTHNPITMSRTDRLFGVTMAEQGVSQLVSVDLTTAQAVAEVS